MKHIGNLKHSEGAKHSKKRIGRGQGSGHGGTSTRGHKGQKSRSGAHVSIGFEGGQMPIARRVPKFGFSNHRFKKNFQTINLGILQKFIDAGKLDAANISDETLRSTGIMKTREDIKILGNGDIKTAITVTNITLSESAKSKIEAAGGSIKNNG